MVGLKVLAVCALWMVSCSLLVAAEEGAAQRVLLSSSRDLLQTTFDGKQLITADSLPPFKAHLYQIPIKQSATDQDILITLTTLSFGNANLYCNPLWGKYATAVASVNFPQPGFAVWSSEFADGIDEVFISKNDPDYRPPGARTPNTTAYANYQPAFVCSVINVDAKNRVNYRLEANVLDSTATLSTPEQAALKSIYSNCCSDNTSSVCPKWKAKNNGSEVFTNFCDFEGQICTAKGALQRLDLTGFNLTCDIPATTFQAFKNLTELKLGSNPFLGGDLRTTLRAVANLTKLHILDLSNNALMSGSIGADTPGICSLVKTSLTELNLVNLGVTGTMPSCMFGENSLLTLFYADNNMLSGSIPDVFSPSSLIEVLSLTYNNLTGSIPSSLQNTTSLSLLDLSSNFLMGTIPTDIGYVEPLKALILRNNSLTGDVPSSLVYAHNMENLDLKENRLQRLPVEWTNGTMVMDVLKNSSLVTARMSFNNLTGSFPTGFAHMPILTFLIINNNSFSGELPSIPGMFPQLRAMNASNNLLTGTIPNTFSRAGIFALAPLQYQDGTLFNHVFDVSHNLLTGTLPAFLNRANVSVYVAGGIFLGGNQFINPCTNQTSYITDLCGTATPAAAGPAAALNPNVSASSTPGAITAAAGIAPSTSTRTANPTPNTSAAATQSAAAPPAPSDGGGGISGPAVAAIVVVALVLLVAAVAGFVYLRRKRMNAGGGGMMPRANFGSRPTGFERYNDGFGQDDELR